MTSSLLTSREGSGRQAVLVAGMHRSGTSAVTKGLSALGGRLPARAIAPQPGNPRGFFEPARIVAIHERILASAGTTWSDWDAFPENWYATLEASDYVQEILEAVQLDYGDARVFLLKDPRICRLLPLWARILRELSAEMVVVLPFRNPLEVAASLRRRNGFSMAHSYLVWLRHLLDAEFASRAFARSFLPYENFIEEPRREFDRLKSQLPVVWPRTSALAYYELEQAVEVPLRRNVATADDLISRQDVFEWLRHTYDAYGRLCKHPLDENSLRALDNVSSEFNRACQAFAPAFQGLQTMVEKQAKEILDALHDLAEARQRLSDVKVAEAVVPVLGDPQATSEAERAEGLQPAASPLPINGLDPIATSQETQTYLHPAETIMSEFKSNEQQTTEGGELVRLFVPPGHFYSPVVNPGEVREFGLYREPTKVLPLGLELNLDNLLLTFDRLSKHFPDIRLSPHQNDASRYYSENDFFGLGDALILSSMIRELKPKRIVEVGSGFSSAVILDTLDDLALELSNTSCTFIDPHPDRLQDLLRPSDTDRVTFLQSIVQKVPFEIFGSLQAGDIVFFDTTHVAKTGSDVNFELFELLPRLHSGVYIHFHDIFWDFEYPAHWVFEDNRSWNELYMLRAFLMYNPAFTIYMFNDAIPKLFPEKIPDIDSRFLTNPGGALWLRKV